MARHPQKNTGQELSTIVAKNVRKYAFLNEMKHETLAAHMTSRGFPMKKAAIAAITGGRRQRISVDEVAAFAGTFEVDVMDMLTA